MFVYRMYDIVSYMFIVLLYNFIQTLPCYIASYYTSSLQHIISYQAVSNYIILHSTRSNYSISFHFAMYNNSYSINSSNNIYYVNSSSNSFYINSSNNSYSINSSSNSYYINSSIYMLMMPRVPNGDAASLGPTREAKMGKFGGSTRAYGRCKYAQSAY